MPMSPFQSYGRSSGQMWKEKFIRGTRIVRYLLHAQLSERRLLFNSSWDGEWISRDHSIAACVQVSMIIAIGQRLSR